MPVVVDYNLCDGVEGCPAITMCDADALYHDPATGRVKYDKQKCRDCGTCANYCGMGAVLYVPTEEEWAQLRALMDAGKP